MAQSIQQFNMPHNEKARKKIVKFVFLFYWILIFEGALRKWFFPQYHEIIFFLRDPIVLFVYFIAWRNGFIKRDAILSIGIMISLLFVFLLFIQTVVVKINPLTLFYGWRLYFYYLPLSFVIKDSFHQKDIHKLIRQTLYISIPLSVLAYFQFISPPDSFINKGYSSFEVFTVAVGIVRTTGTFTFTSGQTMFAASLIAMLVFAWLYRKRYRLMSMPLLMICTGSSMAILLLTGSRTAFFMTGLVVLATFAGLMFSNDSKLKSTGIFLLIFLILIGTVMFLGPLKKSFDAISTRFETAEAAEGSPFLRAIGPLIIFTHQLTTAPFFGNGLGLTSGGGSKLETGKAKVLLAEDDWSRIIVESGPVFGLFFLVYRIYFSIALTSRCLKAASKDNNLLPMIFLGFIGYYLLAGQIASVGVFQGYNWLFVGLSMAAAQKQRRETDQPDAKLQIVVHGKRQGNKADFLSTPSLTTHAVNNKA